MVDQKQEAYQGPVASLGRESPEVAKLYKVIESYKTEVFFFFFITLEPSVE